MEEIWKWSGSRGHVRASPVVPVTGAVRVISVVPTVAIVSVAVPVAVPVVVGLPTSW